MEEDKLELGVLCRRRLWNALRMDFTATHALNILLVAVQLGYHACATVLGEDVDADAVARWRSTAHH